MSARALTTNAQAKRRPEEDSEPLLESSSRLESRGDQSSTSVLMDLAGVDLPATSHGKRPVRRNSTAAIQQTPRVEEAAFDGYEELSAADEPTLEDMEEGEVEATSEDETLDRNIMRAVRNFRKAGDRDNMYRLVKHYRSPRDVSPFARKPTATEKQVAESFPLPSKHTIYMYNACLDALIDVRRPGESIAIILEVYNEMLERDLIPNTVTYQHVIKALSLREMDVWTAIKQWEDQKRWGRIMAQAHLVVFDEEVAAEKDLVMEGYKAEANLDSAIKLFRAASLVNVHQKYLRSVYAHFIEAASRQPEPNLEVVMEVFRQGQRSGAHGMRRLYEHIFTCFGKAKNVEGLQQLWAEYQQGEKEGKDGFDKEWNNERPSTSTTRPYVSSPEVIEALRQHNYCAAIQAFVVAGEPDIAFEIFEKMKPIKAAEDDGNSNALSPLSPPSPPPVSRDTIGDVLEALVSNGYLDRALEWYPRAMALVQETGNPTLHPASVYRLSDALILAGNWREAVNVVEDYTRSRKGGRGTVAGDKTRLRHLYFTILAHAAQAEPEEAGHLLAYLPRIMSPDNSNPDNEPSTSEAKVPVPPHTLFLDPKLITLHFDVMLKLSRYTEFAKTLDYFDVDLKRSAWFLEPIASRIGKTDIPFDDLIATLRAMQRHEVWPEEMVCQRLVSSYIEKRTKIASANELKLEQEDWLRMLRAFTALPKKKVKEGEYDDHLAKFLEDLAELNGAKRNFFASEGKSDQHGLLARYVLDRFGRERATQMLQGVYGEEMTQTLIPPVMAVREASPKASPKASTAAESSMFSIPSTPESMSSAPTSPMHVRSELQLDPQLSNRVDAHARTRPVITPREAYELYRKGLSEGSATHPDVCHRLIVALARAGDEAAARDVYLSAQQIIAIAVQPLYQQRAWLAIEDGMLSACCHLGHLEQAGMHRARIIEAGMHPSADSYATMISCSKDTTDDALVARELFDESRAMGLKPNLFLYNTVISKLSKARKAEMALELFKHMKASKIAPSSVTYGAVIVSLSILRGIKLIVTECLLSSR